MSPSLTALLAAALLTAGAEPPAAAPADTEGVMFAGASVVPPDVHLGASGAEALEQLEALVEGALPDQPARVIRQTRYYGTVSFDHKAHVARRHACKACHGQGVITKVLYTPRIAHERCVGCHTTQQRGPTKCTGCHVRNEPPPVMVAVAAALPEVPRVPAPNPAHLAAALAALEAVDAPRPGDGRLFVKDPFHRAIEVGLAAGTGTGVTLRVASHQDRFMVTQGLDRVSSGARARTLGLLGAGIYRPVAKDVWVEGLGLVGFDAVDRPVVALFPALGLRAGVGWRPPGRFFRQVNASLTTTVDLARRAFGREIGGITFYGTIATGFGPP